MSMLVFQKALAFLRHYWYVPFLGAVAIVLYLVARDRKVVDWGRVLNDAAQAHHDEVAAIEKANQEQVEASNRAAKRMQEAEDQVRAEFERNSRDLDAAKEKG